MRITDVVTPQELREALLKYQHEFQSLGQRVDLKKELTGTMVNRIDKSYVDALCSTHEMSVDALVGAHFILTLIDRFLEEKYANSTSN